MTLLMLLKQGKVSWKNNFKYFNWNSYLLKSPKDKILFAGVIYSMTLFSLGQSLTCCVTMNKTLDIVRKNELVVHMKFQSAVNWVYTHEVLHHISIVCAIKHWMSHGAHIDKFVNFLADVFSSKSVGSCVMFSSKVWILEIKVHFGWLMAQVEQVWKNHLIESRVFK